MCLCLGAYSEMAFLTPEDVDKPNTPSPLNRKDSDTLETSKSRVNLECGLGGTVTPRQVRCFRVQACQKARLYHYLYLLEKSAAVDSCQPRV
jgi:hypothetical protein